MSLTQLSAQLKAALESRFPAPSDQETILTDTELQAATESLIRDIDELTAVTVSLGLEAEGAVAETEKKAFGQRAGEVIRGIVEKVIEFFRKVGAWIAKWVRARIARGKVVLDRLKADKRAKFDLDVPADIIAYVGDHLKVPDFGNFKKFLTGVIKYTSAISNIMDRGVASKEAEGEDKMARVTRVVKDNFAGFFDGFTAGVHSVLSDTRTDGWSAGNYVIPATGLPGAIDIKSIIGDYDEVDAPEAHDGRLSISKAQLERYIESANAEAAMCEKLVEEMNRAIDRIRTVMPKAVEAGLGRDPKKLADELPQFLGLLSKYGNCASKGLQVVSKWHEAALKVGEMAVNLEHSQAGASHESLDGGGLPTEPVNPGKEDLAAKADDAADAEDKTVPAVQSVTPSHVSSQESFLGIGRTLDEKIARKEKKLAEMHVEEKRLRGEFDKERANHKQIKGEDLVFGEIARDIKELEEEIAELKAKKKATASKESISDEGADDARAAADGAPATDEAVVASPDGGDKVVEVANDHAPEESAEDALLAVHDASSAIDGSMRESSELEDAASGLESILLSIREYPQGLTPKDAEYVNMNLESIVGDWGLGQKLCPSYESFGGTHLRREATASLEANIGEVLKSAYEYVVTMFKKFAELVVYFYQQLTNAAKAVARRGEALVQRVSTLQGDAPSKTTVNIGTLAGRLTINGQMPALTQGMGAVMMEIDAAFELENHVQAIESAVGSAAAHLRGLKDDTFSAGFEQVTTAYLSATKAPPIFAQNGEVLQTRVFPGEISYVAEQKEGHWRFRVVKTGKETQSTTIHVPSKADLGKLGERLKTEGQKAGGGIAALGERIKADKGQRFLTQIQGPANNLNDENQRAIAKFVQQCAEDVKAIHALGKEMLTNAAKSMLAIVRVGEISCDLYKAPKDEAAAVATKAEGGAEAGAGKEAPAAPEAPAAAAA